MLIGATTKREDVIVKFQKDPTCQFFLISLKAGGAGLNLTEAGYVMLLDPWWNPAAELQAINRAHRIGQDKKVIAYKFITSGTIEEKMLVLQQKKQFLSDAFVPAGNPLKDLSREEIREMFG
jgi:SNF2 family DNA or RNA helicase